MDNFDRKNHWENIYQTKQLTEVSWHQPKPETSLAFLEEFKIQKTAKIMDAGGGDSFFVDYLLAEAYEDLSVLDISEHALERAQKRLGEKAALVKWIISDASTFEPDEKYDFWHDRAVFHFLTEDQDIENYLKVLEKGIQKDGILVIGTFSENGPLKCSGIPIKQYSEATMTERLSLIFEKISCFTIDHTTPFNTTQNFIFCSFRKK